MKSILVSIVFFAMAYIVISQPLAASDCELCMVRHFTKRPLKSILLIFSVNSIFRQM